MFELKRFFGIRNTIIILLLFLLSMISVQNGMTDYKDTIQRKSKFQEIEKAKVEQYINYLQYGVYGFRTLFVPAPISVFFINSGVIRDMTSYVDSGERLKIYTPLKGKNIFNQKRFGFTDFSGIILFFGTLLAIFYGYETFNNTEYLKFLSTISSKNYVFFSMIFARVVIMFLVFFVITCCALLLIVANGFFLHINAPLVTFVLSVMLISLFFFALGTIFSTIQSKITGIVTLLSCWFILLYFIPTVVNTYIVRRSDLITPVYELEMEKLKILTGFEKRIMEKEGTFKEVDDSERRVILRYWNNEFVKIQEVEEKLRKQMKEHVLFSQKLSVFFPSTFYSSVTDEISGRGYENLLAFYSYMQTLKRKFFKFYMDKRYFSNYSKVEPFVKNSENIFYSHSFLPTNLAPGVSVNMLYIIVLFTFSYSRFRKSLFALPINENLKSPAELELNRGELAVLVSEGELYKNLLFDLWNGELVELEKKGYDPKVRIAGPDPEKEIKKESFFYFCHPENIPGDITTSNFLSFMRHLSRQRENRAGSAKDTEITKSLGTLLGKRFSRLKIHEKGEVMLAVLRMNNKDIYLLYDTARGMPIEFTIQLKEQMDLLTKKGSLVVYLTHDELINVASIKKGFHRSSTWVQLVDHYKGLLEI